MGKDNTHKVSPNLRLMNIIKLERRDIGLIILLMIGVVFVSLGIPLTAQAFINTVIMGNMIKPLVVISIILLIFLLMTGIFYVMELYVAELIQRRIFVRTTLEVCEKMQSVLYQVSREQNLQELMNRFFKISDVQKTSATLLTYGLGSLVQGVGGSLILIFYSVYFLPVILFLVIVLATVIFFVGARAESSAIDESSSKFTLAAWLESIAGNLNTFKFSSGIDLAKQKTETLINDYIAQRRKHFKYLMIQYFSGIFIYAFGGAGMLALGGILVIKGYINLGQFVAAELIIFSVLASFLRFIGQLEYFYDLMASLDKIGYLQDLPQEKKLEHPVDIASPNHIRAINLGYDFLQNTAHQAGINFELYAGQRLAVLGSAGSGKSSLGAILAGLRTPSKGRVEYNRVDATQFEPYLLRKNIGYVSGVEVIDSSVIDNILIGRTNIPISQVTDLLGRLGLLSAINNLPNGLQTQLHVTGEPLSSSEILLVMLARAIIDRPSLLILDGLLDVLEEKTLALIKPILFENRDSTIVIMTKLPSIAQCCDQILKLEAVHND